MTELAGALPWVVNFLQFCVLAFIILRMLKVVDQALGRAQGTVPVEPKPVPAPVPVPVVPQKAPEVAKPSLPFDSSPPWYQLALKEVGFHETGNNQGIEKYIAAGHCGKLGDPWCAIFANAMLETAGIPGTRSASSQSFRSDPNFVKLAGPAPGAIVVFWRISETSGQGHVGFYRGEDASRVWVLGGNENDMVQIEALPKSSKSFGLIGYWWPKGVPLPQIGPVQMPAGSPVSQTTVPTTTQAQTNIVATVFGGEGSAYGGQIDDNSPGVALPFRFPSPRPQVKVTNRATGKSVICDIVDVGPWNINDPYWTKGSRPEAESGFDMGQTGRVRPTNKAGIDLTAAAAKAIGVDGKGLVDWSFVDAAPKVT